MYFFYARINSRGLNRILLRVQNYTHLQTNITSGCEVKTYFGLDHNHVSPSVAFMGFISPHSSCFQEPGGRKPQNNSVLVSELHTWQNCILFTDCPLDEYVLRQLILWILWHKYIFFGDWSFYGKPSSCPTEGHTAAEGQENQNSTVFCWNEHSVLQLNLANREIENNWSSPKSSPRRKEAAELFFSRMAVHWFTFVIERCVCGFEADRDYQLFILCFCFSAFMFLKFVFLLLTTYLYNIFLISKRIKKTLDKIKSEIQYLHIYRYIRIVTISLLVVSLAGKVK